MIDDSSGRVRLAVLAACESKPQRVRETATIGRLLPLAAFKEKGLSLPFRPSAACGLSGRFRRRQLPGIPGDPFLRSTPRAGSLRGLSQARGA